MGCQIATVQRFRLFAKAAAQEVQLSILAAARSQVRHFCLAALRPAALQPAACSLAVRNLLPAALPAALQCATCCLQPCSAQPAACSLATLQPAACSLAALLYRHFGLFAKAVNQTNLINLINFINLFSLINLINLVLARTLVCDVQVCSSLVARRPPVLVGGIGRRPLNSPLRVPF